MPDLNSNVFRIFRTNQSYPLDTFFFAFSMRQHILAPTLPISVSEWVIDSFRFGDCYHIFELCELVVDAIASPCSYPCQSVGESLIVSDLEIAIASFVEREKSLQDLCDLRIAILGGSLLVRMAHCQSFPKLDHFSNLLPRPPPPSFWLQHLLLLWNCSFFKLALRLKNLQNGNGLKYQNHETILFAILHSNVVCSCPALTQALSVYLSTICLIIIRLVCVSPKIRLVFVEKIIWLVFA